MTSICSSRIFGGGLLADLAADRISEERSPKEERAARAIPAAPALAKDSAVARPTPFEAPVIRM